MNIRGWGKKASKQMEIRKRDHSSIAHIVLVVKCSSSGMYINRTGLIEKDNGDTIWGTLPMSCS